MNFIEHYLEEKSDRPSIHKDILFAHEYKSPRSHQLSDEEKRVREVAYDIKDKNNLEAISVAAKEMADLVNSSNVLIPIPNSKGDTTANKILADGIAQKTGAKVQDVLGTKKERESNLLRSKAGKQRIKPTKMGLKLTDTIEDARNVLFVDNVAATGSSIRAAINLINGGRGLVYARVPMIKKKVY